MNTCSVPSRTRQHGIASQTKAAWSKRQWLRARSSLGYALMGRGEGRDIWLPGSGYGRVQVFAMP